MQVELPPTDVNKAGAQFNRGQVLIAVSRIGLQWPVRVRWAGGIHTRGGHNFKEGEHRITISTFLNAEQISQTLWHELAHALQCERLGSMEEFRRQYRSYSGWGYSAAYRENPFEVEARQFQYDFHAAFPLA